MALRSGASLAFAASILLVAGCSEEPRLKSSRGPIHQIVTFFDDGSWVEGTCFAIAPHEVETASHCVFKFAMGADGRKILLDGDPVSVQLDDQVELELVSISRTDDGPAILHYGGDLRDVLATGAARMGEVVTCISVHGDARGAIITTTHAFDCWPDTQAGWSGAPLVDEHGVAVGVLWGADANGIGLWYPALPATPR